ncbi:glutathione peroxidase 7-like [Saccostrea echinata]|uniref:glutathione peroxidase 7-like n=1 Tax=Saccostrea echinata TaxID=191078 RepID=UPI002A80F855|nr:glutathione peroxidase 7-like [Saccostrea echinata]
MYLLLLLVFIVGASLDSFYSYSVKQGDKEITLSQYAGKVVLVVNVASECGYTDGHYRSLVRLQDKLGSSDKFSVLAFPCNQFGKQEPGSYKEILSFAKKNYKVNFPIFSKINVMGEDVPDAWKYLIENSEEPTWNFWKYLVDEKGQVVRAWGPWISVDDITQDIIDVIDGNYSINARQRGEL